jgi:glycosyltransferase involved in cell wall biosynthesis
MRTAVFSIVSPNYRHFARVLMGSVQRNHPEWERFVLFVGDASVGNQDGDLFASVRLEELSLPNRAQFCFRYTILELNTAVKPWMFAYLFGRGFDRIVYLDPDIFVYTPLAELDALPPGTLLALTPHLTGSIGGDAHPSERTILQAGTYNLGFLAVTRGEELARFLAWWQEKLEYQCVVDTARGIFVDQKWMDLTPGLFAGVAILRHDGYNVAYWNLGQRTVVGSEAAATVNGQPLRFFHFSGYDPAFPDMVSKHDHVLKLTSVGDAAKLIEAYGEKLRTAGYESFRRAEYAYGAFFDGTPVTVAARVAYRNSKELQAAGGDDPFAHPELFSGLRDAPRRRLLTPRLRRSAYTVLSGVRPLVGLFPAPLRKAMRELVLGHKEAAAEPAPRVARQRDLTPPPLGLNIVGYLARGTGVGESARLCQRSCEAAGLPSHLVDVDSIAASEQEVLYPATIYHVNADQTPALRAEMPRPFVESACNIGCWHWELPELPDAWIPSAAPLDEIWAPSAFVQSAVSGKVTIPVVHMPHGIEVRNIEPCSPQEFGVPAGRFTFLCMFDLDSVVERKNPLGAVEAFRRAFPSNSPAALLIKTSHAGGRRAEYLELEKQLHDVPNVHLTERTLSRGRVNGLLAACDGVLSLHRSEGFGLIMAEGMYLGKPVVATGWSGNMDFMDAGNSCPVAYELVTLDRTYGYYQAGQQWAEPDVEHAAQLLRRVVEDDAFRTRLGARARDTIRGRFSPEAAGLRYRRRLEFLGLKGNVVASELTAGARNRT